MIPNLGSADDPNLAYNNALPLLMNEYLPNGMLGLAITGLMASFMAGVAANVSAFNTVVTTDIMEPYVRKGETDEWYVRFGRGATIAGLVVAMGTALIASTYDNLMNYVQALFSIFNAPLFARVHHRHVLAPDDAVGGLLGAGRRNRRRRHHVARLQGRLVLVRLRPRRVDVGRRPRLRLRRHRRRDRDADDQSKPVSELQGLVYGMANEDEYAARRVHKWWESPKLLGFTALAGAAILTIIFW